MDRKYQVDWTTLLAHAEKKRAGLHSTEDAAAVEVFLIENGTPTFWAHLPKVGYTGHDADIYAAWVTLEPKANGPAEPRTPAGLPMSTPEPREGDELILPTHNFCDPTTWYTTSARVVGETLTDSGDGLTFTSANAWWIDMTHGKCWDEDALCLDVAHGYSVDVTSDAVAQTERAPFAPSGGDYVVDYAAGTITFASSQAGKTVLATYSRKVDSTFTVVPDAGTTVNIESAIARFSTDFTVSDSVVFEIWAYDPNDPPNKVVVKKTTYKTLMNFVEEASPPYAPLGTFGGGARGIGGDVVSLPFRYGTVRPLRASQGLEIRVYLQNHTSFPGTTVMATFYCTVAAE